MTYPLEKIILFEVDRPLSRTDYLNAEPGIFFWKIVQEVETFTDDHGTEGYYQYLNSTRYIITIGSKRD